MPRPHALYDALCVAHSALDILSRAAELHTRQSYAVFERQRAAVKFRDADASGARRAPTPEVRHTRTTQEAPSRPPTMVTPVTPKPVEIAPEDSLPEVEIRDSPEHDPADSGTPPSERVPIEIVMDEVFFPLGDPPVSRRPVQTPTIDISPPPPPPKTPSIPIDTAEPDQSEVRLT